MSELSESAVPEVTAKDTVEAAESAAESALGTVLEAGALEVGALGAAVGAGDLAAIGDAMLKAAGDSLLRAAGDIAGQAEKAGEGILRAAGEVAGEAVESPATGERPARDRPGR